MNRLKNTRAYLCGAMTFDTEYQVIWRKRIGDILRDMGVTTLDPTDKPIDIGQEKIEDQYHRRELRRNEDYDAITEEMKLIRCIDLRMVDVSDFIIVDVDTDIYTVGTWEEVTTANRQKKPIIFRIEQGKINTPDWIFGMVPHQMIFDTWGEVADYLKEVDSGRAVETYKRWCLFDLKGNDNE